MSRVASARSEWPARPDDRDVVLHARVVTGTGGGPDKTVLLSAQFLAATRYWPVAAYMHPPDDPGFEILRQRASIAGCPLVGVPDRGPLDPDVPRSLHDLCRRLDVGIWHGHDYKSNLLGLLLRPFHPMKLVTTVHGWVKQGPRTPLYYALDRWCLPRYDHVTCVSDDLLERLRQLGVREEQRTLLHNAVDERIFSRDYLAVQSPLRDEYGVPSGRLVIGAVGRLSPEKAFDSLIEATAMLLSGGLDLEVWIVGEGDSRSELQALIDSLNLQQRVRLLGFRSDLLELYHAMDVFVLSSVREGLPNAMLEALAMGVPVVSTAVAGVPRLIKDGRTGLLCPIGNVQALAAVLARALTDGTLRADLARAGRALIEQDYSFRLRMAREVEIYDRVLGIGQHAPFGPQSRCP